MIVKSLSLKRALVRETLRRVGSLGQFVYYRGDMPQACEDPAAGEHIDTGKISEAEIRMVADGVEPMTPPGRYWRLIDNDGNVVMQGDGK